MVLFNVGQTMGLLPWQGGYQRLSSGQRE